MIFNSKKETTTTCTANNGLTECDSVAKIKEYQKQLSELALIKKPILFERYFLPRYYDTYLCDVLLHITDEMIRDYSLSSNTYEEYFSEFGLTLDVYINQERLKKELNDKIKNEKDKLGIE